jgi:2-keto-4-pentenoate hydratase
MSAALKDPRIAEGMRAQLALRERLAAEGARQIGWKVGMGAAPLQQKLKLTAPIVGFLLDSARLEPGAALDIKSWQKPVAEAEVAAYIGRDLPAMADRETARRAIAAIGPAIELVDVDCDMHDVQAVLSGDIFQRHVVLGPRDNLRQGARLQGLKGRLTRSGQDVPVPGDLETNTGDIVNIVRHVADMAAALGDGLRAGQFVICGSITAPLFLEPADAGVNFALDPIGAVSVRFSNPT